jgi:ABC-type phosphate transport system substrate-binding protein
MKRFLLGVLAVFALAIARQARAQGYVVIVNGGNTVKSLSREQLTSIFLKKTAKWDGGAAIAPVDQDKSSKVRESFTKAVHGRSVSAVDSYWQQQIFAGKDVPPPERSSDTDVIAYVRSNPNAIGYVSAGSTVPADVKVLGGN